MATTRETAMEGQSGLSQREEIHITSFSDKSKVRDVEKGLFIMVVINEKRNEKIETYQ